VCQPLYLSCGKNKVIKNQWLMDFSRDSGSAFERWQGADVVKCSTTVQTLEQDSVQVCFGMLRV
jgi:hypothetical protein